MIRQTRQTALRVGTLFILSLLLFACGSKKMVDPIADHYTKARDASSAQEIADAQHYVTDSLDIQALADSPLWDDYLNAWVRLYRKDQASFAASITASSKSLITRAKTDYPEKVKPLVRTLVEALVELCELGPAAAIASFPHGYNISYQEYSSVAQRLLNATLLPGKPAPPIEGLQPSREQHAATLVFFYESRCRSCQAITADLVKHRDELKQQNIRVVAVSGDTDPKVFDAYAEQLQWADLLCDYKAFEGSNFVKYDVASTPTLYVIDRHGRVVDQYQNLSETRLLK